MGDKFQRKVQILLNLGLTRCLVRVLGLWAKAAKALVFGSHCYMTDGLARYGTLQREVLVQFQDTHSNAGWGHNVENQTASSVWGFSVRW